MFDGHRSLERLLFFALAVACVHAQAPATTTASQGLFGGADKKRCDHVFVQAALSMTDAVTSKQILDPAKFQEGWEK